MKLVDAENLLHEIILGSSNSDTVDLEKLIPFLKKKCGLDKYLSLQEHGIENLLERGVEKGWYELRYDKSLITGGKGIVTITIKHP
ncbi:MULTISPECIES: hypothetical protein [Enterobacteriaceae]|uniref:hypothetical protein n=1 Tax=Enterobacteriaceae TaxID=543 RepID=UPI000272B071|nr:hypothetical protein [Enterobacter sp. Ag1]EJF31706.1 hypothetical protein A936_08938 [Enterobacter sp. Ag1]